MYCNAPSLSRADSSGSDGSNNRAAFCCESFFFAVVFFSSLCAPLWQKLALPVVPSNSGIMCPSTKWAKIIFNDVDGVPFHYHRCSHAAPQLVPRWLSRRGCKANSKAGEFLGALSVSHPHLWDRDFCRACWSRSRGGHTRLSSSPSFTPIFFVTCETVDRACLFLCCSFSQTCLSELWNVSRR